MVGLLPAIALLIVFPRQIWLRFGATVVDNPLAGAALIVIGRSAESA